MLDKAQKKAYLYAVLSEKDNTNPSRGGAAR